MEEEDGQPKKTARILLPQGRLALVQGNVQEATSLLTEGYDLARKGPGLHRTLETGQALAQALVLAGEQERAYTMLEET